VINRRIVRTEEWSPIFLTGSDALLSFDDARDLMNRWQLETGTDPEGYFNLTARKLVPKNWSGVLPSSRVQLEVKPEGALALGDEDTAVLDFNVGLMLEAAISGKGFVFPDADISNDGQRIHAIISGFLAMLGKARKRQVLRQYKVARASTQSVVGRIVFPAQLIEEIRHPGHFVSEWVSLDENTPENRFLKAVLSVLRPLTNGQLRARLEAQLITFDKVPHIQDPRHEWRRIRFDRVSPSYGAVLRLAKAILDGEAPGLFSGGQRGTSEIVFTARAFEHFASVAIDAVAPKVGYVARLQSSAFLGVWRGGKLEGKRAFEVIPDVQLFPTGGSGNSLVLDTKWKRLRPGASMSGVNTPDIYQVVTYAARFGHKRAVLLYPWMGKTPLEINSVEIDCLLLPVRVFVATVPLLDPGFRNLERILQEIIKQATG
jgi:hypothetical protein